MYSIKKKHTANSAMSMSQESPNTQRVDLDRPQDRKSLSTDLEED